MGIMNPLTLTPGNDESECNTEETHAVQNIPAWPATSPENITLPHFIAPNHSLNLFTGVLLYVFAFGLRACKLASSIIFVNRGEPIHPIKHALKLPG